VDFISTNIYENHLERLRRIHTIYPDKPVYVSEFGIRTDAVASEEERVRYLRKAVADFRACGDFLMGASVWTFNDYESIFPGSNANGYRPWGLVSPEREIREMYRAWQDELAPATAALEKLPAGQTRITLEARADFPRRTLRDCRLIVGDRAYPLPTLAPGASTAVAVELPADSKAPSLHLETATGDRLAVALDGSSVTVSKK
jgi:beta-glucuronidase